MISALIIARLLLAAVFVTSAVAKIADLAGTRKSITDFGLAEFLAWPAGTLLPLFELACAIALIPATSAWWGAAGVLAMLIVFIGAMLVNMARGRTPDCHCFGQMHSERIGWKTVVRNLILAAVALLILWPGPNAVGGSLPDWAGAFKRFETAVLAFGAIAAFQLWFSIHLLRQNGRLMLRVEALEAKQGPPIEPPPPGLPVESAAPDFSLPELDGATVTLTSLEETGRPLVLIFSDPLCSMCDVLLPEIAKWQREFGDRLWIGLISRGSVESNRDKTAKHDIQHVLLQSDREIASAYRVEGNPSAVLVTGGRIASPLAAGADEIRRLVSRATLPATVAKGDRVPSLRLADLSGESLDLATLRGRRTLLLFWNPSCGFCQQMLPDVKAWERNPPEGAPELMIISSGSFDANRAQGFRSRVLLDADFGAGYVFRSGGTPSAVMLDQDGRIASEVSVGAQHVFALAGGPPAVNGRAHPVSV